MEAWAWMLGAVPGDGDAAGQKAVRDMACISLDLLTLVPLMMAWLLRLLQDWRRKRNDLMLVERGQRRAG